MRMIYVDVSMVMIGTNFTGIPRVVMEVSKRLAKHDDLKLCFLEYNQKMDCYEVIDTNGFAEFCTTKTEKRNHLRTKKFLRYEELAKDAIFFDMDTVWKTRLRRSFLYPILKKNNIKIVPFIQDIIGITHPQFCPVDDMLCFIDYIGAALEYSDEIVITSNATKAAIEKTCDSLNVKVPKISIVPLGSNYEVTEKDDAAVTRVRNEVIKIGTSKKYLLMVGTIDPRKNHKLLLDAYDNGLKELGFSVVIAGYKGWNVAKLVERMENHSDFGNGIYHINGATDEEISYLYEHSFALAFPSYIEGYGLPIMESLQRGTLVLAADTPINMETGGEYALYFKEDHPEKLVALVKELSENKDKYNNIKDKISHYIPPTWEESSEKIYEVLRTY